MTENEWLNATSPQPMLEFLRGKASERKLRLFCIACCRHVWHLLDDTGSHAALVVAERLADGEASNAERRAAFRAAPLPASGSLYSDIWQAVHMVLLHVSVTASRPRLTETEEGYQEWKVDTEPRHQDQTSALRCIFGDPFASAEFAAAWRTSTALALARQMYDARDFSAAVILADAIQDAGCEQAGILDHLRGPGPHVRGCWVIDLILGKE